MNKIIKETYRRLLIYEPLKIAVNRIMGKYYMSLALKNRDFYWIEDPITNFICDYWIGRGRWTAKLKYYTMSILGVRNL